MQTSSGPSIVLRQSRRRLQCRWERSIARRIPPSRVLCGHWYCHSYSSSQGTPPFSLSPFLAAKLPALTPCCLLQRHQHCYVLLRRVRPIPLDTSRGHLTFPCGRRILQAVNPSNAKMVALFVTFGQRLLSPCASFHLAHPCLVTVNFSMTLPAGACFLSTNPRAPATDPPALAQYT